MTDSFWPNRPYKGLAPYSEADTVLLAGRENDTGKFIKKLRDGNTAIITLHGRTATGKSSFLRAAVIPELKKLPTYEVIPAASPITPLLVRSTQDPLGRLADSVYEFIQRFVKGRARGGRKRPADDGHNIAELRGILNEYPTAESFRSAVTSSHRAFHSELGRVTRGVFGKLILFIDQGEEIVASRSTVDCGAVRRYFDFLHWFCEKPLDAKICVSLRSEYKALFDDELFGRGIDPLRVASYHLGELDREGMIAAILHPTKPEKPPGGESALEHYKFKFRPGVVEEIAERVMAARPAGGVLPTLQVICDRLYEYTRMARQETGAEWYIGREDFLSLGPPQEQILSHVKESLYEALREDRRERGLQFDLKHDDQFDAWLNVLTGFAELDADGRATTRTLTKLEVFELAERCQCLSDAVEGILKHLTDEREYVITHLDGTGGQARYALMHDAVALVLSRWKREELDVLRPRKEVIKGNAVLRAASFKIEDLYPDAYRALVPMPGPVRFETIDDNIWDHLLAIYAKDRGFSDRLGFEFKLAKPFARPSPPEDESYQNFLNARTTDPKLLVIPPVLFPTIRPPRWKTIGICNVFRGYALIGKQDDDLAKAPLEKIAATISEQGKRVAVFEDQCLEFYNLIGEVVGLSLPKATRVPDDSGSDVLYLELISGRTDFIVGSAPTRARCEQAGFRVYYTVDDLLRLARERRAEQQIRKIEQLLMHEVWTVEQGGGKQWDEETLLRLGSVLFYTVQYILNDPEDFVRFIHYQMQEKTPEGTIPVDLAWVRKATAACYQFTAFDDYLHKYLLPGSDRHFLIGLPNEKHPEALIQDASSVHDQLTARRCLCDDLLSELRNILHVTAWQEGGEVEKKIVDLLTVGKRHYQIYNFHDAGRFLNAARSLATTGKPVE
jgi:hypothetical protein